MGVLKIEDYVLVDKKELKGDLTTNDKVFKCIDATNITKREVEGHEYCDRCEYYYNPDVEDCNCPQG